MALQDEREKFENKIKPYFEAGVTPDRIENPEDADALEGFLRFLILRLVFKIHLNEMPNPTSTDKNSILQVPLCHIFNLISCTGTFFKNCLLECVSQVLQERRELLENKIKTFFDAGVTPEWAADPEDAEALKGFLVHLSII